MQVLAQYYSGKLFLHLQQAFDGHEDCTDLLNIIYQSEWVNVVFGVYGEVVCDQLMNTKVARLLFFSEMSPTTRSIISLAYVSFFNHWK